MVYGSASDFPSRFGLVHLGRRYLSITWRVIARVIILMMDFLAIPHPDFSLFLSRVPGTMTRVVILQVILVVRLILSPVVALSFHDYRISFHPT